MWYLLAVTYRQFITLSCVMVENAKSDDPLKMLDDFQCGRYSSFGAGKPIVALRSLVNCLLQTRLLSYRDKLHASWRREAF